MTGTRFANFHPIRKDRLIQEFRHDPYQPKHKLPESTACPNCGAVYHHGHWQWASAPAGAHQELCPACHRIHDEFPAGFITLGGEFFKEHRDEILHLVHNEGERFKAEHPLKRVMAVADEEDGVMVTTTDIHLARDIGEALHHAYHGELEFHYNEDDNLLRVHWTR